MAKRLLSLGLSALIIGAFSLMVQMKSAHAYIDLGTGSYLLQMLLATVLASIFMLKVFWHRLTSRIARTIAKFKAHNARVN